MQSTTLLHPEPMRDHHLVTPERRLRGQEVRLLATIATGATIPVIAQRLGVSDRTVRRHIRDLCSGIGVATTIEAVAWAARRRLI